MFLNAFVSWSCLDLARWSRRGWEDWSNYSYHSMWEFCLFASLQCQELQPHLETLSFPKCAWDLTTPWAKAQKTLNLISKTLSSFPSTSELFEDINYVSCSVASDSLWPHRRYPPGSSVRGILQARILEWVAIPFSGRSSWPRDWPPVFCFAGRFFTTEPRGKILKMF